MVRRMSKITSNFNSNTAFLPKSQKGTNIYRVSSTPSFQSRSFLQYHSGRTNGEIEKHPSSRFLEIPFEYQNRPTGKLEKAKTIVQKVIKKGHSSLSNVSDSSSTSSGSSDEYVKADEANMAQGERSPIKGMNQAVLPNLTYKQVVSVPEFNTSEEVLFIENNVWENDRLSRISENIEDDDTTITTTDILLCESSESIVSVVFPKTAPS